MKINEMVDGFKEFGYEDLTAEVLMECSPTQLTRLMYILEDEKNRRVSNKIQIDKILNRNKKGIDK